MKQEGVPLYEGSALENLNTLELGEWERRGGKAAYTRLGEQETNSLQIVEIPPKGELKPEHHIYDAIMYVMQGRGASVIWQEGEKKHTVEWEEGVAAVHPAECLAPGVQQLRGRALPAAVRHQCGARHKPLS